MHFNGQQLYSHGHEISQDTKSSIFVIESQSSFSSLTEKTCDVHDLKHRSFKQRYFGGLKSTLTVYLCLTAAILLFNFGWLLWAIQRYNPVAGYGTIHRGTCEDSKTLNLWFHFAINILSTGLLLGSASFIAAAMAPSRGDIDEAHHQARWLSIGLLSSRNLKHMSTSKVIVCVLLAISSVPIHLFFNSVVFPSLASNDYFWAVVDEDFVTGAAFNVSNSNYNTHWALSPFDDFWVSLPFPAKPPMWQSWYEDIQRNVGTYERLENDECIRAYSQKLISDRRNVIVVSTTKNETNSIFAFAPSEVNNEGNTDPTDWLCSIDGYSENRTCDARTYLQSPGTWAVYDYPVAFCLSEQISEPCSVKFSTGLALIIIVSNALKLTLEVYILLFGGLDHAIPSIGDAIKSFLVQEDEMTVGMGVVGFRGIDKALEFPDIAGKPNSYERSRHRWYEAVSSRRWLVSLLMLLLSCIVVAALLGWGVKFISSKGFDTSVSGLWTLGFGAIDPEILIAPDNFGTPVTLSLLANTPQLVLAILYYTYHALLTAFFAAQDYASYGFKAQYLRVSNPVGNQRGTWLLGMPVEWGLLFLAIQVLLHWFVSQGLFVADVDAYTEWGVLDQQFGSINNCGFSPMPMLFAIIVAILMMVMVVSLGARKFPANSPSVAGNSSATIAAACHSRSVDPDITYKKLKWGLTHMDAYDLGHCSFASAETREEEKRIAEVRHDLLYH